MIVLEEKAVYAKAEKCNYHGVFRAPQTPSLDCPEEAQWRPRALL